MRSLHRIGFVAGLFDTVKETSKPFCKHSLEYTAKSFSARLSACPYKSVVQQEPYLKLFAANDTLRIAFAVNHWNKSGHVCSLCSWRKEQKKDPVGKSNRIWEYTCLGRQARRDCRGRSLTLTRSKRKQSALRLFSLFRQGRSCEAHGTLA
jgi:hypothetical protein